MKRPVLGLALVATTAASVTVLATHHHHKRPARVASARLASVTPISPRASRSHTREPLGHVKTPRARPQLVIIHGDTLSTTAYCATGHATASGKQPRIGMAANNRYPFGTHLHVVGYGDVVVEDRIGWGSDLDLFFGDDTACEQRALDFGRRQLRVVVEQ